MVSYNSRTALTLYRTTDVKSAVTRLGVSVLQDLVLSVAVFRAFTANEHISREYIEDLHRHAQLTARIGSGMTRNTPWISACTLAALLHDIGKLVIAERLPAHLARTLRG
jgi:HD-like signal output (HDOD) protein